MLIKQHSKICSQITDTMFLGAEPVAKDKDLLLIHGTVGERDMQVTSHSGSNRNNARAQLCWDSAARILPRNVPVQG